MHRTRYYRNPAMYYLRSEIDPSRYGYGPCSSQMTRSAHKRNLSTTYPPAVKRPTTVYRTKHAAYNNSRFVDQSKYVWTANKQQQSPPQRTSNSTSAQTQATAAPQPSTTQPTHTRIVSAVKKKPTRTAVLHNGSIPRRELGYLNVTALDTPNAVAVDIASKLREDKLYVIKTVVDVLGVKKAIKLFYETREKELKGGLLTRNGKRRRTPGGVYLALLRESTFIPKQEADKVFLEIKRFESRLNKNPHFMKF